MKITLKSVLALYKNATGKPFFPLLKLTVVVDNKFWALVEPLDGGVHTQISTGCSESLTEIWNKVSSFSVQLPKINQLNITDIEKATNTSLTWLMLHELHHYELGHFKISNGACIVENDRAHQFAIASFIEREPLSIDGIDPSDYYKIKPCLELQADADSTEMLLGAYSPEGWDELRFNAACIFGMMVLIEREEVKTLPIPTHPKAATRTFMTIAHLKERWSVLAKKKIDQGIDPNECIPSVEELEAYNAVVAQIYADAVIIAKAAGADNVVRDLGEGDEFFNDAYIAQTAKQDRPDLFATNGAKEWSTLWHTNQKLLEYLQYGD